MWATLLSGLLSKGFSFFTEWREEKAKQATLKLQNETKIVETTQNIRYEKATADVKNTSERIAQMAKSFKDEFTMFVIFTPLVTSMISPYVDLYFVLQSGSYELGMLAAASSEAIASFNNMPVWYTSIVILMIMWSWGASKEIINKILDLVVNFFKK